MGPLSQTHPGDPLVLHSLPGGIFFFFFLDVFICLFFGCSVFVETQTFSSLGEQGLLFDCGA